MERNWLLGDDLAACDNLLDGITFDDIITQVHCNCPQHHARCCSQGSR